MIKNIVSTTSKNETYALVLMFNYGIHDKKHADMIQHKNNMYVHINISRRLFFFIPCQCRITAIL